MALGTITPVSVDPHGITFPISIGDVKMTVNTVVGDSSYTTGGTALSASALGLQNNVILFAICTVAGSAANNGAISATYNLSSGKLQMWASSGTSPVGLVEAGAAANLSGVTVTIVAIGY